LLQKGHFLHFKTGLQKPKKAPSVDLCCQGLLCPAVENGFLLKGVLVLLAG
jgi:hypothetical protein